MRLLKNNVKYIILFVLLFSLCGCSLFKKQYESEYIIEDVNIFNQIENEYFVYFYKTDCPYCDDVYDIVNDYLHSEANTKLYVCDLTNSSLKKIYEGSDGQGTEGLFFVNGVTMYNELHIAAVPSLIKVSDGISEFIVSGRKKVIEYLDNILINIPNHVHQYKDGVCACGDKQVFTVFFKDYDGKILKEEKVLYNNQAKPPQLSPREGYLFTGWDGDIYNITKSAFCQGKVLFLDSK